MMPASGTALGVLSRTDADEPSASAARAGAWAQNSYRLIFSPSSIIQRSSAAGCTGFSEGAGSFEAVVAEICCLAFSRQWRLLAACRQSASRQKRLKSAILCDPCHEPQPSLLLIIQMSAATPSASPGRRVHGSSAGLSRTFLPSARQWAFHSSSFSSGMAASQDTRQSVGSAWSRTAL
jgi:hypothetical protein